MNKFPLDVFIPNYFFDVSIFTWITFGIWCIAFLLSLYHCISIAPRSRSVSKVYALFSLLCISMLLLVISSESYGNWVIGFTGVIGSIALIFMIRPSLFNEIKQIDFHRNQAEEKVSRLEHLASKTYEGIFLIDPETLTYLEVNSIGAKTLKYRVKEMIGMRLDKVLLGNMPAMRKYIHQAMNSHRWVTFKVDSVCKNGSLIKAEVSIKKVKARNRELILAIGKDMGIWIKNKTQLEQITRLYQVVTQVNRAITRSESRDSLFHEVCTIATRNGGFLLAWIGLIEKNRLLPVAVNGVAKVYVNNLKIELDQSDQQTGPIIRSLKEKKPVCINNTRDCSGFRYWCKNAEKEGFRSAASVPLFVDSDVVATLVLYADQANVFDDQMQQLLTHLSEDISFAINHIAKDVRHKHSQKMSVVLSSAVDQSADAVTIFNEQRLIEYINPKFTELTGYNTSEALGQSPGFLSYNEDEKRRFQQVIEDVFSGRKWRGEFRKKNKKGDMFWSMDTLSPIRDDSGKIIQCVLSSEDYTALKKAQDKIEQLAFYDSLTGLPNRRLLHDRMKQAFNSAKKRSKHAAILFLDIDKFKLINDSLGHNAGDKLLKEIACRLEDSVRPGDTVARLGGDEFTIILFSVTEINDVIHVAERVLEAFPKPIELENQLVSVTASIGITLFPDDCEDIDTALRNADLAMYHAKSEGRNNLQFYTSEMNSRAMGQIDFERRLRLAISKKQFKLFYQPQVDFETGIVSGVEALIRWVDDKGENIPPDKFIPLAEEIGLIWDIGQWVIIQACKDCRRLGKLFSHPITMAINISAHQFKQADALLSIIKQQLDANQLAPEQIELELTESMLIDDVVQTVSYLKQFRKLGLKLAIDDFGTGYSSLSYLKQFPINTLKIDRSFVSDIEDNQDDAAIASIIIALAHELRIDVLAEGVETEGQLGFLKSHQCDFYQGYYYSRPVPFDDLVALFNRKKLR